ncbi:MAG: ATP-binding cassette subfamily B bacterial [Erysipelotrichaceae bacterium]|nr:MAG: ATP-binding cassette subfamily B [Erysipelotrichaceae bacterium]TXT18241.1 MAG: ATP-binding cassette subfamily B bacterial [Erysipelotrichaceae bacterium]
MTSGHGPMMAMRTTVVKPKDFSKTVKRLIRFTSPFMFQMTLVIVMAMAGTIFAIIAPKLVGNITSKVAEGLYQIAQGVPNAKIDLDYVNSIINLLALLYSGHALFTYLQSYVMVKVTQKITFNLRLLITEKINHLPLKYFDTEPIGDVLSRITYDVDTIAQSFQQSVTQSITALTTVIGILFMMFSISFEMTLIALISLPISLFMVTRIVKIGQKYYRARTRTLGMLNGHIEESFANHPIIKVFNGENQQTQAFEKLSTKFFLESWKSESFSGMMMPIISLVSNLSYIAVSVLGATLVIQGQLQVGSIQAFIQYIRNFSAPINQVANIGTVLQSTVASAERVFEFVDQPNEAEDQVGTPCPEVTGAVSFRNVDFGYSDDNIFIKNLNIEVKPGQRVAIVGPTGAGKTTLINLLMRFYDVKGGSIEVDGIDIRTLSRYDLRNIFGMVLQDTWLFNGSIRENIKFSDPKATEEQMLMAADSAKVDHFVQTLPEGYDLLINEEANNISSGQKQLLTIARAFMSNPSVLILDEATSSVDTRTEVLIQRAMEKLMGNKTSFIIAHRLSTIKDADLILVMNHGAIIEQGTHVSLMDQKGFYTSLYLSQFEPES